MFDKSEDQKSSWMALRGLRPPVPRINPSQVSDPLSRRLLKLDNLELSKPSISDTVYIGTNESNVAASFEKLSSIESINGCHVGFSGWYNLDIAAERRSSRVIICDINPENAFFLGESLRILRKSVDPDEFIQRMIGFVEENEFRTNGIRVLNKNIANSIFFSANVSNDPLYQGTCFTADELRVELKRPLSWVFDLEKFYHIKRLAISDKIVVLTENICNTETFLRLKKILMDNGVPIETLYLSNIADILPSTQINNFLETVGVLSPGSTVIHAPNCVQEVFQPQPNGEDLKKHLCPPSLFPDLWKKTDQERDEKQKNVTNSFFKNEPSEPLVDPRSPITEIGSLKII